MFTQYPFLLKLLEAARQRQIKHLTGSMASILDTALAEYGSNNWVYQNCAGVPQDWTKKASEIDDPIDIERLVDPVNGALRKADAGQKTRMLISIRRGVPEFPTGQILDAVKNKRYPDLPACLQPRTEVPKEVKLGFIVDNKEDGTCDVVCQFILTESAWSVKRLAKLCSTDDQPDFVSPLGMP
jgi:hypothetical protein